MELRNFKDVLAIQPIEDSLTFQNCVGIHFILELLVALIQESQPFVEFLFLATAEALEWRS